MFAFGYCESKLLKTKVQKKKTTGELPACKMTFVKSEE